MFLLILIANLHKGEQFLKKWHEKKKLEFEKLYFLDGMKNGETAVS